MDTFGSPWPSSPRNLEGISNDALQMDALAELHDGGFEPQTRARSNTWPLPRPENYVEPNDDSGSTKCSNPQLAVGGPQAPPSVGGSSKKNSSRRNAWGNLSYADLITQAINSATDNRLTLSQIYEWMVQNVPYFKDKGDSNSSAGWKNSIRHNLSLHNRFVRVQNEGTGKSSWWMLNPDAKPGKSVRRRAASMETSKFEKRRGRAKKRVEAIRNGALGLSSMDVGGFNDATPSPSSSVSEGLDIFPDSPIHSTGFQLSPDFRQRASSNASSCGRLSPIPALEPDWGFPSGLDNECGVPTTAAQTQVLDQLAGSLADDLTFQNDLLGFTRVSQMHNQPPPPYQPPQPYSLHATVAQSYCMQQPNQCPMHRLQQCTCLLTNNTRESMSPSSGTGMSPSYPHSEPSPDPMGSYNSVLLGTRLSSGGRPSSSSPILSGLQTQNDAPSTLMGQFIEALTYNSQQPIDDFNIDTFPGGIVCNVDEVIKHELSMDGSLDFNFPVQQQIQQQQQQQQQQQHQQQQTNNYNNTSLSNLNNNINNNNNTNTNTNTNTTNNNTNNSSNNNNNVNNNNNNNNNNSLQEITLGTTSQNQTTQPHSQVQYTPRTTNVTSWVHCE